VPGKPRSGRGVWARWRDWLLGTATDHSGAEREERTTTTAQGDDAERIPPPSLDNVLRDAAQRRDPRDHGAAGPEGPTGS
jgi:hypothetical protein